MLGNAETAASLARCLAVDPEAELPFTHGFHAYPARMHPETARRAIEIFQPKVRLLDPFAGSGTTAVEALRAGVPFTGMDISRVALEIAWVRTRLLTSVQCRHIEDEGRLLSKIAGRAEPGPLPPWARKERDWYPPHTLREIALLKNLIEDEPSELRRILMAVLSSIVVKLSRQASDSITVRDAHFRPRSPGMTFRLFQDKCSELGRQLFALAADLRRRGVKPAEPEFRLGDARKLHLPSGSVDLVLTSPPYPGTYDYHLQHARRYPLYNDDGTFVEQHEIGSRRHKAQGYGRDLRASLDRMIQSLTRDGRIILLIGDGLLPADSLVRQLIPVHAIASQRRSEWIRGRNAGSKREHLILCKNR